MKQVQRVFHYCIPTPHCISDSPYFSKTNFKLFK